MCLVLRNVNFFVLGYLCKISMRFNVAKEKDGDITGKSEDAKTEVTVSATTAKTEDEGVVDSASAENSQDVNQNLKNVKLEDLNDEEDDETLQQDLSKSSDEIEEQITNLIATGHMFKAHVIAKKAFQKHPENVNIAQAYSLVLLKTGALD